MHIATYLEFKNRPYIIKVASVVEVASLVSIIGLLLYGAPETAIIPAFILNFMMQHIIAEWKIAAVATATSLLAGSFYLSHPEELEKLQAEWKPKEL